MISYIELQNFLSFSDIRFDLQGANDEPKKLAFLYGENASGKTSIVRALSLVLKTFGIHGERSLKGLIMRHKSIGVSDPMVIKIGFRHAGESGWYLLKFNTDWGSVIEETLYYGELCVFDIRNTPEGIQTTLNTSTMFDRSNLVNLGHKIADTWGIKVTFAAHVLESKTPSEIYDILNSLAQVNVLCDGEALVYDDIMSPERLAGGLVESKEDTNLRKAEDVLNLCFTQMFSDIKKAFYVFNPVGSKFKYELVFLKNINNNLVDVPFSRESIGTKNVLGLISMIWASSKGLPVIADLSNLGNHDVFLQVIVDAIKDALEHSNNGGQFIATTHNTLLLDSLRPEDVYILRLDSFANKEISCVAEYSKSHEDYTLRQRYLIGIYEGIPILGHLDFTEFFKS